MNNSNAHLLEINLRDRGCQICPYRPCLLVFTEKAVIEVHIYEVAK